MWMMSNVDTRRRRSASIDQDVTYRLGLESGWNVVGRTGPIDDAPGRNVENAGAIGVRRDDLYVVPTLRQRDGGLGHQDRRAAESRREPGDDLEDPHKGARINGALGRTTGNVPGPRRSWQCVGDKGSGASAPFLQPKVPGNPPWRASSRSTVA